MARRHHGHLGGGGAVQREHEPGAKIAWAPRPCFPLPPLRVAARVSDPPSCSVGGRARGHVWRLRLGRACAAMSVWSKYK